MAHVYQKRNYERTTAVWQESADGQVPNYPVIGGHDVNGEPLYIGRAVHASDTIPGKIVQSHRACYVAHGGHEHAHYRYQVLTNPNGSEMGWVQARYGNVPPGALVGGQQSDGQNLYIGRGYHNGSMVIGKVHPSHNVLYVPFAGNEVPIQSYEVLVVKALNFHNY